jgi:hypothetical protein
MVDERYTWSGDQGKLLVEDVPFPKFSGLRLNAVG